MEGILESQPQPDATRTPAPVPLEDLRHRLYKAIRATILGLETPSARRGLLDRWLNSLLKEGPQEITFPEELAEAQQAAFQAGLGRAVNRCRRLAGAWFFWDPAQGNWELELKRAVDSVARGDEPARSLIKGQDLTGPEAADLLRHRLRQRWCGGPEDPETFQVEAWLEEVGFFSRELMEIGSWARLFHTVALLHHEGVVAPDLRRQKLEGLLEKVNQGQPLESIPELIVYLDGQVRGEGEGLPPPFNPPLDPELFPGRKPEAVCWLIREALGFLSSTRQDPEVQSRLAWLAEHLDLIDLKDLLLLFLSEICGKDPMPAPSEVLDLLQLKGYPIRHQDFRDEYRAQLVPLEGLAATAAVTLRLPLDPAALTGNPELDLDRQRERQERRRLVFQAFKEEALHFLQGEPQPLPQAELIRGAARFAVTWLAARKCLGGESWNALALAQEAGEFLPPPLLKLIRPRKGYELTHKSQLNILLHQEAQAYQESLERCRVSGRIANDHDDALFLRLAAAVALAQRLEEGAALSAAAVLSLELAEVIAHLGELAARFSLDLEPGGAPRWYEFKEWLTAKLAWPAVLAQGEELGVPAAIWDPTAAALFQELARQLYRLMVARARGERGLPPLPGDQALLSWLAAWFTPEKQAFREGASRRFLDTIRERARRAVWESYPLVAENREEVVSLIKYYLQEYLKGQDLETYARRHKVAALPEKVAGRLKRCQIHPGLLPPGGVGAVIQEVLRPRTFEATQAQRQLEEEVLALLPRTDCGSCGAPGCLAFARLLVQGRARAAQCLQSPGEVKAHLEEILAQAPALAVTPEPYDLTGDDELRLTHLLDPHEVALRQRLTQELAQNAAQQLVPLKLDEVSILQIGKSPDAATFHRYLEDYLGYEAAHRLTPADLAFLTEQGDLRLAAEAQELQDSFSWLEQETRAGLSGLALSQKDPALKARQAYGRSFFLHDLSPADQSRVKEFRVQQFLGDFLENWEQALTEHWQAGYRLEDWEDFAQIVAKSFWHQEHTPPPGEILTELTSELANGKRLAELGNSYLEDLVREQLVSLEETRKRLEMLLNRRRMASPADLDFLTRVFAARAWQELTAKAAAADLPSPGRLVQAIKSAFHRLDQANLTIPGHLRVYWDEISPRVRELLVANPQVAPEELAHLQSGSGGLAWREMHTLQAAWIKAQIEAAAEGLLTEEQEVQRLLRGDLPCPTPGTVRRATRHLYWSGKRTLADILEVISASLAAYPDGRQALGRAALARLAWDRLINKSFLEPAPEADPLTRSLDRLLKARSALNVQKLKAYMFLLARMEGNLDKLTALLREIRETSDIIEAAWLAFTEERIVQPRPSTATAPTASTKDAVPLLASSLPDQERLNRYLKEGLPRGEPREYSQAYWELITLLQFYVVGADPQESPEQIFERLESGPYDLQGLSREALLQAIKVQAQQRGQLLPQKISICTYVLGHRLAGRHPHLLPSEAAFLKEKGKFLKVDTVAGELQKGQWASTRGVELGKIKNELYSQISDLLKEERTESFARRIGQIIARLEEERAATLTAFRRGELNRLTAFYILRRFQKDQAKVSAADLGRFLMQYQPGAITQLQARLAPEVIAEVDRRLEDYLSRYRAALRG